jgi:hypothetical protein
VSDEQPEEAGARSIDLPPQPDAGPAARPDPEPAPEPTPVVGPDETSWRTPPGTAAPASAPLAAEASPLDRVEVQAGLAFAGGLLAAMVLRRLGR